MKRSVSLMLFRIPLFGKKMARPFPLQRSQTKPVSLPLSEEGLMKLDNTHFSELTNQFLLERKVPPDHRKSICREGTEGSKERPLFEP
jgi:hypothetical protein